MSKNQNYHMCRSQPQKFARFFYSTEIKENNLPVAFSGHAERQNIHVYWTVNNHEQSHMQSCLNLLSYLWLNLKFCYIIEKKTTTFHSKESP